MIKALIEADFHCGHVLGLTPPHKWDDENISFAKPVWNWRRNMIEKIGPVDIHIMNGDLTDGPGKKETIGLLTTDIDQQADWAVEAAEMVKASARFVIYGTPFHTVSTLSHERLVSKALGCVIRETLRIEIGKILCNFRHVVGRSDTPYGQATQLAKEVTQDYLRAAQQGYKPARLYGRAHAHYFWREKVLGADAFISPCWELPNPDEDGNVYARKLRTQYYNVGDVLLLIDGENIEIREYLMPLNIVLDREYIQWQKR